MVIVAITDLHGHREAVEQGGEMLEAADIVIVTGDITHFGREREAEEVIGAVMKHSRKLLAVPGNCDYPVVGSFLAKKGYSLDRRCIEIDGYIFAGIGGSLPCPGITPNESTENEFAAALAELKKRLPSGNLDFFISHQPPYNTHCDLARGGIHVGSSSVRTFIEEIKPAVCLTGHIHEAAGEDRIGKTVVANPGPLVHGGYTRATCTTKEISVEIMSG